MYKSITSTAIILLMSTFLNAQPPRIGSDSQKGLILNANFGSRLFGRVSDSTNQLPDLALQGGIGYLWDKIGIMGRVDYYNHFLIPGYNGGSETHTRSFGVSLLGNFQLISIFAEGADTDWRIDAYLGGGLTSSWNRDMQNFVNYKGGEFNDPFIPGYDDMGHIIVGFTPKYYFNECFALSLDVSTFMLFSQDFTYDYTKRITGEGLGGIMTISMGLVFRIKQ
jgi:hypothetical protein